MSKSQKFDKVKGYYDGGLWKDSQLRDAVEKGWITAEEFEEITGKAYTEE